LHCIVLYYIALYCIALHCIALHCIVLHCIVLYCIALYCIALYCIALHGIALHCIVLYCTYPKPKCVQCKVLLCRHSLVSDLTSSHTRPQRSLSAPASCLTSLRTLAIRTRLSARGEHIAGCYTSYMLCSAPRRFDIYK
jgi:hypothetical protein